MSMSMSEGEEEEVDGDVGVQDREMGGGVVVGVSQPRDFSSWRISRRIMASGTRAPDRIVDSALMPFDI